MTDMRMSQDGIDFVKSLERYKSTAYDDGYGNLTVGWGHTKNVSSDTEFTAEQAEAALREDIAAAEGTINRTVSVPLSQNQFDAMVSVSFNGGYHTGHLFNESLNSKDALGIAQGFLDSATVNKKMEAGVVGRRLAEADVFFLGIYDGSARDVYSRNYKKNQTQTIINYLTSVVSSNYYSAFPQCFPGSTPILVGENIYRNIDEIGVGDIVFSFDASTDFGRGTLIPKRVTRLYRNVTSEWIRLRLKVGGEVRELVTTPGHRFLDQFGGFPTIAKMIESGYPKLVLASGEMVEAYAEHIVYSAETASLFERVKTFGNVSGNAALKAVDTDGWQTYNFEVEDLHTYVAGGVRVHNDSGLLGAIANQTALSSFGALASLEGPVLASAVEAAIGQPMHELGTALDSLTGYNGGPATPAETINGLGEIALGGAAGILGGVEGAAVSIAGGFANAAADVENGNVLGALGDVTGGILGGVAAVGLGFVNGIEATAQGFADVFSGVSSLFGDTAASSVSVRDSVYAELDPSQPDQSNIGAADLVTAMDQTAIDGYQAPQTAQSFDAVEPVDGEPPEVTEPPSDLSTPTDENNPTGWNDYDGDDDDDDDDDDDSPVILDLSGKGLTIKTLNASTHYQDMTGHGELNHTAWAADGEGVLAIDGNGDGKIDQLNEIDFKAWDPSAKTDIEAIAHLFDSNHNGQLDAGDAAFSKFRVVVDGKVETLAEAGISSINLMAFGAGQTFTDGSKITGTTTFTRTDGTTGLAGDATFAFDSNNVALGDSSATSGSKTVETLVETNDAGVKTKITTVTSYADANGVHRDYAYDTNADGVADSFMTDVTMTSGATTTETQTYYGADDAVVTSRITTVTTTDANRNVTITTSVDSDGDGHDDTLETYVQSASGATSNTTSNLNRDGSISGSVNIVTSSDGLTKTTSTDHVGAANSAGETYDSIITDVMQLNPNTSASSIETITTASHNGQKLEQVVKTISTDRLTVTRQVDSDGDGNVDTTSTAVTAVSSNGTSVTTQKLSRDGSLISAKAQTTSADGLTITTSTDDDGLKTPTGTVAYLTTTVDATVLATDGSRKETITTNWNSGTLASSVSKEISADKKTITIHAEPMVMAKMIKRQRLYRAATEHKFRQSPTSRMIVRKSTRRWPQPAPTACLLQQTRR